MTDKFKKSFLFSKGERMALSVLCVFIIILFIINILIKQRPVKHSFVDSNLDSLLMVYHSAIDSLRKADSINKSKILSYKVNIVNEKSDDCKNHYKVKERKKTDKFEKTERKVSGNIEVPTVELNVADTVQLKMLPGIGSSFSKRIVEYRKSLGGYVNSSQLLEIFGMDTFRYNGFSKYITIDVSKIKKMNVNNDDFKTLLAHPYLEYDDVKDICNYREKRGLITSWDMLIQVMNNKPDSLLRYYIEYQ